MSRYEELERVARRAAEYEPPWDLAGAELPPAAYSYWLQARPDVILALLDERERLRAALEGLIPYANEYYAGQDLKLAAAYHAAVVVLKDESPETVTK